MLPQVGPILLLPEPIIIDVWCRLQKFQDRLPAPRWEEGDDGNFDAATLAFLAFTPWPGNSSEALRVNVEPGKLPIQYPSLTTIIYFQHSIVPAQTRTKAPPH